MQEKKVCLVIGAGAGIGVNVAKKFASSGYHAVISRRTNQEGLDNAVANIEAEEEWGNRLCQRIAQHWIRGQEA